MPLVIDDSTPNDVIFPADYREGYGLVPRDLESYPPGCYSFAPPAEIQLIPRSEWSARIKEMEETKSRISDVRNRMGPNGGPIPYLNQGSYGYCWAHSTTHAVMLMRALQGQPYVPLSAFAVAATIKNGRNEGGWGALSLEFAINRGIPSQKFWPQGSANVGNGTQACWDDAAKHKPTEDWQDLTKQVYFRNLTFDQVMTLLLSRIPVIGDFNWWQHSIVLMNPVEVERNSFGIGFLNSHENFGDNGYAVLRGDRAIPDGATAPRSVLIAA